VSAGQRAALDRYGNLELTMAPGER
jgi:hypothetical protein